MRIKIGQFDIDTANKLKYAYTEERNRNKQRSPYRLNSHILIRYGSCIRNKYGAFAIKYNVFLIIGGKNVKSRT